MTFNASAAWSAQAVNNRADGWCSVFPTSGNACSGTITITAKENNLSYTIRVIQLQKDAIVLAKSLYEFSLEGGNLDFEIETKSLCLNVAKCNEDDSREGTIKLSGREVEQIVTVKYSGNMITRSL